MQEKTKIENIQKMLILFEQNQRLITIKGEHYDILLERYPFENIKQESNQAIITLRFNKHKDIYEIMQKMAIKKFMHMQVSIFNEINIQISYTFDIKHITLNHLLDVIQLMEEIV